MTEWFRETFGLPWLRASAAFHTPERNARDVAAVLALLERGGVTRGSVVGDLPCGAGRVGLALAKAGHRVVGLDIAHEPLQAALAARDAGASFVPVRGDLRALPLRPASLDAALTLEVSIGYGTLEEDRRILRGIAGALRPGGCYVLEQYHRDGVLAGLRPSSFHEAGDLKVHVRRSYDAATRRYEQVLTYDDGRTRGTARTDYLLHTAEELRALLAGAGLEPMAIFGSLRLEPFHPFSPRFVALARRPA